MENIDTKYLDILRNIMGTGEDRPDRTGIGSRTIWGVSLHHSLQDGFPIIQHRKVSLRIAFEELMWMLRGSSDVRELQSKNIHIWDGNSTREFLDNRGLNYLPTGHIGKSYGFNMRNFGGDYNREDGMINYYKLDGKGTDQLVNLLKGLKADPNSRRHLIFHYDPHTINEAALPSCHYVHQYQVVNNKLNSSFTMRSWDFCYGAPYNLMFYGLLNMIIAKYLKLESGDLYAVGMDTHVYFNQFEMAKELIDRRSMVDGQVIVYSRPMVYINKELNTIDDILSLQYSDITLTGYQPLLDVANKPAMAV